MPLVGTAEMTILEPGGVIRPHYSDFNAKVVCHLGVRIPKSCALDVAGEARAWKEGEFLVFDDTYLHSVKNEGDSARVILLLHAWHRDLTPVEVTALDALLRLPGRL